MKNVVNKFFVFYKKIVAKFLSLVREKFFFQFMKLDRLNV